MGAKSVDATVSSEKYVAPHSCRATSTSAIPAGSARNPITHSVRSAQMNKGDEARGATCGFHFGEQEALRCICGIGEHADTYSRGRS